MMGADRGGETPQWLLEDTWTRSQKGSHYGALAEGESLQKGRRTIFEEGALRNIGGDSCRLLAYKFVGTTLTRLGCEKPTV